MTATHDGGRAGEESRGGMAIRAARPSELTRLEQIERAADELLVERFGAKEWPRPATAAERAALPGFILVIEFADTARPVVGFVHVLEINGHAHLEQLSVLPDHGRKGYGRMLVTAAKHEARRRGYRAITLRTYRDVPWNAPFYASCGFRVSTPSTPFLSGLVDVEARLGLERYGRRVHMTAEL